ncbi:MAG: SDR family oxidoreductase [Polyangiaceae bacterium]|nr:SDR family oxidoreductase [Polyangiaceae bacterium]
MNVFAKDLYKGHTVLVTGGGSGIGLAIAELLGGLGARVAICGRKQERLDAALPTLRAKGIDAFGDVCDIREPAQIETFLAKVEEAMGSVSILINNAGGQFPTTAETLSSRGWEAVIRNNLNGTFFMTQAVANKWMIPKSRGTIVNIIANVARGFPGMVHTGAARAGVENMTKTLAVEWARYNLRINAIAPGIIKSSGTEQYPQELVEMSRQRTPMKRVGTPAEVADLVGYLACDAASYVTGETWYIDGGAHLWGDTWLIPEPGENA